MKSVISLYLLVMLSYTIGGDSITPYSNDNYIPYNDNKNYQNNYNDYNYNSGDKNYGNDNHGNVHTHGKFIAYGNADKGLKYHQITYFHKGSKYQKKFVNYDTKGKVHSYGKQNVKAKFNIESNIHSKGKYNGGKFDQLVGSGSGQYGEGQIPIEYAAAGNGPTYNAPSTYEDNSNNNNYNDQNSGGSSDDNTYSSGTYNDNYQQSY
ncbi:unnamed protein product [Schistosoma spindalis]|nr:unnamed protein product [Schistosoma spindale]